MHYLIENPVPLLIVEAVAALLFGWRFLRMRQKLDLRLAIGLGVIAVAHVVVAQVVVSPREHVAQRTEVLLRLAEQASAKDRAATQRLREMFADEATLRGPDGDVWADLDATLNRLNRVVRRHGGLTHRVMALTAEQLDDDHLEAQIEIRTVSESYGRPFRTRWQVRWERANSEAPWQIQWAQWLDHPHGISPRRGGWRQRPDR